MVFEAAGDAGWGASGAVDSFGYDLAGEIT
jgi:hypothetical protein